MKQTATFRDAEQISAYLDGQLSEAEARRLSARLQADPELASVAEALRQARDLLRQTPQRRAPRNFTLKPSMAGIKPPVPRAVPFMRLASVLAAFLLFITFAVNSVHMLPIGAAASMGYGMGGGGAEDAAEPFVAMESAPEAEAPVEAPAPEMRAAMPTPEPAPTFAAMEIPATEMPQAKVPPAAVETFPSAPPTRALPVSRGWQAGLATAAILFGAAAFLLVRLNDVRWRRRR